ncbi:MAG: signal peptidase I [Bryobacterales bacterium]|nr:signal peptidase I [Bryobacterales bacterium]
MTRRLHSLAELAVTGLLYFFVTTCLAQGYVIPTGSMEGTLLVGDHLVVDKVSYAPEDALLGSLLPHQPIERGAIIVFRYPLNLEESYVKRVIGMPGDRIRIQDKQVFLNGSPLDEPYAQHVDSRRIDYRDDFPAAAPVWIEDRARAMLKEHVQNGELVVPPGHYFALGDNRDNSSDSRFWGLVPRENIYGKPLLVYWSFDAPTDVLLNRFSPHSLVRFASGFFSQTRWERFPSRVE